MAERGGKDEIFLLSLETRASPCPVRTVSMSIRVAAALPVEAVRARVGEHGVVREVLGALAAPQQAPDHRRAHVVGHVVRYY